MSRPDGLEIERKFLLTSRPDTADLERRGAKPARIEQIYLVPTEDGEVRRARRLVDAAGVRFVYTTKRLIGGIVREEHESEVDEDGWRELVAEADPALGTVRKTRWTLDEGGQRLEIDLFEDPPDLALVEVELSDPDEAVHLPAWLGSVADVSEDPRYLNVELARTLGPDGRD